MASKSKNLYLHKWIRVFLGKKMSIFRPVKMKYIPANPFSIDFNFHCNAGVDFRRSMVLDMACPRRLDVHSINTEFMCHIAGSICGRHTSRHVSEHNVNQTGKNAGGRRMGAVVRHLLAAANWT